ncbi:MAG: hypothetical protein D6770_07340 [Anaerolineae bacterium]|nr:MAG: hypothetical protein D6770_07340 [Anaerolineae bacterium]
MEIFGIGMPELLFIALIAILVLGPEDMQKTGRKVGQALRRFMESGTWKALTDLGNRIRNLPYELAREANPDLAGKKGRSAPSSPYGAWGGGSKIIAPPSAEGENTTEGDTSATPVEETPSNEKGNHA